jgi:hypothetical protein
VIQLQMQRAVTCKGYEPVVKVDIPVVASINEVNFDLSDGLIVTDCPRCEDVFPPGVSHVIIELGRFFMSIDIKYNYVCR